MNVMVGMWIFIGIVVIVGVLAIYDHERKMKDFYADEEEHLAVCMMKILENENSNNR